MILQYILDNTDNQAVIDYITSNPIEAQRKLDKIIKQISPMLEIECIDIFCGSCGSCQSCGCDDSCTKQECPMPEEIYMLYEFLFESQVSGCNDCNDDRIQSQKIDDVTVQYFEQKSLER